MAGGNIVSITSGVYDTLFGEVQAPLKVLIEREYDKKTAPQLATWEKIFHTMNIDSRSALISSMGNIGLFEDVGENGDYPNSELGKGFDKLLTVETWKNQFSISQEMIEDKLDFVLTKQASMLIGSFFRTRAEFYNGLLVAALKNKNYISSGGKTYDTKTFDGINLFSTSHKLANSKKTVSNAFANEFSATNLGKVSTQMQNMVDDNGVLMNLIPNTIIIPNTEKAKDDVFGAVGAYHDPDVQAGNRYNYQFGNWEVITDPWLNVLVNESTGAYPWMVMDSNYNRDNYGAIAVERIPLVIKSEIEKNDANVWKGRARFGGAFGDFRAFAAGGLAYGDEL